MAGQNISTRSLIALCYIQGFYFLVTGMWPLLHIDSFIAITGPKTDLWLVRTVGAQIMVVSMVLLYSAAGRHVCSRVAVLAIGSAAGFAAIDIYYSAVKDRISNVYLADAVMQLLLIAAWMIALVYKQHRLKKQDSYV